MEVCGRDYGVLSALMSVVVRLLVQRVVLVAEINYLGFGKAHEVVMDLIV